MNWYTSNTQDWKVHFDHLEKMVILNATPVIVLVTFSHGASSTASPAVRTLQFVLYSNVLKIMQLHFGILQYCACMHESPIVIVHLLSTHTMDGGSACGDARMSRFPLVTDLERTTTHPTPDAAVVKAFLCLYASVCHYFSYLHTDGENVC